jgi:hypothetical protein
MPTEVRQQLIRLAAELLVLQLEHRAEEQATSQGRAKVALRPEFLE